MECDLHMHSTASDGTIPPERLAELAVAAGLGAIALTDHDTTEGLCRCAAACVRAGIGFVPGIEVSADPSVRPRAAVTASEADAEPPRRGTLHILGLFVRHDDPLLGRVHERMRAARDSRNPAIVARLQGLGVDIAYEEVEFIAQEQGTKVIGRPHIARVLMGKGYVKSIQAAFTRYIGQGAPAYVRRDRLPAAEAIDAIHHAGGLAVMAHPVQLGLPGPGELEHVVARLSALGLDGIETHHPDHSGELTVLYTRVAQQFDLLVTGGSDFHGSGKSVQLGSQHVPMSVYEALRDAWQSRRGTSEAGEIRGPTKSLRRRRQ